MKCNEESERDVNLIMLVCMDIIEERTKNDLGVSLELIKEQIDIIAEKNKIKIKQ